MFRKLFGSVKTELPDISKWNEIGREVAIHNCAELEAFHQGKSKEPKLSEDARDPTMAEAVLQKVVALNLEGRGHEARDMYDPAHTPFITELEKGGRGLTCCAILGPEDYLVQQGTAPAASSLRDFPTRATLSPSRNRTLWPASENLHHSGHWGG